MPFINFLSLKMKVKISLPVLIFGNPSPCLCPFLLKSYRRLILKYIQYSTSIPGENNMAMGMEATSILVLKFKIMFPILTRKNKIK
jgi:hypothetical protein